VTGRGYYVHKSTGRAARGALLGADVMCVQGKEEEKCTAVRGGKAEQNSGAEF